MKEILTFRKRSEIKFPLERDGLGFALRWNVFLDLQLRNWIFDLHIDLVRILKFIHRGFHSFGQRLVSKGF